MASTEGLMPITRAYLASYYDRYPFTPLSDDVSRLSSEIRSMANDLLDQHPPSEGVDVIPGESILIHEADSQPPHKIDENLWKNREYIEEMIFLLEKSNWPELLKQQSTRDDVECAIMLGQLKDKLRNTLTILESFQIKNSEHVFNTVMTYLPQDFLGTLLRQQRERLERNKQAEVDTLVNSGGSIRDRYALLWKQQMDRKREQLAVLEQAIEVYTMEFERFMKFISEVFANSPFFISAEAAGALEGSENDDDYKEKTIPAGKSYQVLLSVDSVNSYIAWDFSLVQGKINMDIGFSLEFLSRSGETTLMLPYRRYESDQGNFCTLMGGSYKLIWDNSYSTFFKKCPIA